MFRVSVFIFVLFNCSVSLANNHILYSVEKDGRVSHILGTMHSVNAELDVVHPLLPKIIDEARVALVELYGKGDSTHSRYSSIREFTNNLSRDNAKKNKGISTGAKRKFNQLIKDYEISEGRNGKLDLLSAWNHFPPGFAILLLEIIKKVTKQSLSIDAAEKLQSVIEFGLDSRIEQRLFELKTPVISLDANNRYLQAFVDEITIKGLSQYIMSDLENFNDIKPFDVDDEKFVQTRLKMEEQYFDDNFVRPSVSRERDGEQASESRRAMLSGRNKLWAPVIMDEVEDGDALIAVGIGHLHYESKTYGDNLLDILRDNGYTLKALPKAEYTNVKSNSLSCSKQLSGK